ncbi:MAG: hypothetical protein ACKV22_27900 [Bryobacteraceae bacterium]
MLTISEDRRNLLIVFLLVLAIRVPFLNHPVQGDDVYYLAGAQQAQIDPLHPTHARYVFLGDWVDMRGHPHPPLNAWLLGALLAAFGDVREIPFHAAYLLLSLVAAGSMYALARRFSPHPLWATLLFSAVTPFVVNGNSFESDVPFLAFWMAGVAAFVLEAPSIVTSLALLLAALTAFQAVFLTPILGVYAWLFRRRSVAAWLLVLVPPAAIAAWQLFELVTSGSLPLAVLGGHFDKYGFQALANKIRNMVGLAVHAWWIVPPFLPVWGVIRWTRGKRTLTGDDRFLLGWIAIFFCGAMAVFFTGSARYLLPMAAPVCLLVSRLPVAWLAAGFGIQLLLSLGLAWVNLRHWQGYREFALSLREVAAARRVWINGEWGLRFYLESLGGVPMVNGQPVRPGEVVVTSELGYPAPFTTGGGTLSRLAETEIRPALPLRLIALDTRSIYSTYRHGYWPFDVSGAVIDRVRAEMVVEHKPSLEYLTMGDRLASEHIVSGVDKLEEGRYRWMSKRAVFVLKNPGEAKPLRIILFRPDGAAARSLVIEVEGQQIAREPLDKAGAYSVETRSMRGAGDTVTVALEVDQVFYAPGDRRQLGVVLVELGFR